MHHVRGCMNERPRRRILGSALSLTDVHKARFDTKMHGDAQIDNTTLICIILLPKFNNMNFSHIYLTSLLQSLLRFRQSQLRTKLRFVNLSVTLTFSAFKNRIKILSLHLRGLQISLCILKSLYTVM